MNILMREKEQGCAKIELDRKALTNQRKKLESDIAKEETKVDTPWHPERKIIV